MQEGQPIYFDFGGNKVYGIVKEVLPDKKGVIAFVNVVGGDGKPLPVEVSKPHKVRDVAEANEVFKAFGLPTFDLDKAKKAISPPEPLPPKEIVPIDPEKMFNDEDIKFLKFVQECGTYIHPNKTDDPTPA